MVKIQRSYLLALASLFAGFFFGSVSAGHGSHRASLASIDRVEVASLAHSHQVTLHMSDTVKASHSLDVERGIFRATLPGVNVKSLKKYATLLARKLPMVRSVRVVSTKSSPELHFVFNKGQASLVNLMVFEKPDYLVFDFISPQKVHQAVFAKFGGVIRHAATKLTAPAYCMNGLLAA